MDYRMIDRLGLTYEGIERYVSEMVAWRMANGYVKSNAWGIEICIEVKDGPKVLIAFGVSKEGDHHYEGWYIANARGKNLVCTSTGLDSHEAVRVWQGKLAMIDGVFPWGGAVIDEHYGLCIGFSGCKEDEDILIARDVRNWLIMHADRVGEALLKDARDRGEQEGRAGADRFTRM